MLWVQIKSNYRRCGPSASLRKDIGDTDGYLMFFCWVFFLPRSPLKQRAVGEVAEVDLRARETPLETIFLPSVFIRRLLESLYVKRQPSTQNKRVQVFFSSPGKGTLWCLNEYLHRQESEWTSCIYHFTLQNPAFCSLLHFIERKNKKHLIWSLYAETNVPICLNQFLNYLIGTMLTIIKYLHV